MAKDKVHRFGEVCRLLDVQPYVLRYWETEFPALASDDDSGQRTYTDEDLAVVQRIKELLYNESFTLVGAKKKLQAELDKGELQLSKAPAEAASEEAVEPEPDEEPAAEAEVEEAEPDVAEAEQEAASESEEVKAEEKPAVVKKKAATRKKASSKKATTSKAKTTVKDAGPSVDVKELKAILGDARKLVKELQR